MSNYSETLVSASGTRHIVGIVPGRKAARSRRIETLCGFGIDPEEAPPEATRDCEFCQAELADIRRQEPEPVPAIEPEAESAASAQTAEARL